MFWILTIFSDPNLLGEFGSGSGLKFELLQVNVKEGGAGHKAQIHVSDFPKKKTGLSATFLLCYLLNIEHMLSVENLLKGFGLVRILGG